MVRLTEYYPQKQGELVRSMASLTGSLSRSQLTTRLIARRLERLVWLKYEERTVRTRHLTMNWKHCEQMLLSMSGE
jgi:hypothetical protein